METEDPHEKDPEVISTVGQNDGMSKVKLSEFPSQKDLMEKELEGRNRGNYSLFTFVMWQTGLKHWWSMQVILLKGKLVFHNLNMKAKPGYSVAKIKSVVVATMMKMQHASLFLSKQI